VSLGHEHWREISMALQDRIDYCAASAIGCRTVGLLPEAERWEERRDLAKKALEAVNRERHAPDPLGEALNMGDGSYRP
jgi:hypothetical protein